MSGFGHYPGTAFSNESQNDTIPIVISSHYIGIDIGIGLGAKIGLFRNTNVVEAEALLATEKYGKTYESFAASLEEAIEKLLSENKLTAVDLRSIGIACAGILNSDGSFFLVANFKQLNGHNLKARLEETFGIPVGIENDANAGALAEWSVLRLELIYWVFGGGWGGAWVDRNGIIQFPVMDWDGEDKNLHLTNEPGYAIPLEKLLLKTLFNEMSASYELYERIVVAELDPPGGVLLGPGGNPDTIRAELILSGPGRLRLFRALVGDDDFYQRFLDTSEHAEMDDPAKAGKYIDKLSNMRVEAAVNTDRLYGKVLARATRNMLKQAFADGMPEGLPICLGGKPSYALPYFGPSAQRALARLGMYNYMRPSVIDERGSNANLIGSAVLAKNIADQAE